MSKRATYQPKGKMFGPALTHMREVAYGNDAHVELHRIAKKQEQRNDSAVMSAADEKRARKAKKRSEQMKRLPG